MNVFSAAYAADPQWGGLLDTIEARTGTRPTEKWVEAVAGEVMAHIRRHAPCRRSEWVTPADLPDDTATVLLAVLKRELDNPNGIRTEQAGEYSVTYAGAVPTTGSPLTADEVAIVKADAACSQAGGNAAPIAGLPTIGATIPADAGWWR